MDCSNTLVAMFERQVKKTPQALALRFENRSLTYAELNQRATLFAHQLKQFGIKEDLPIAIYMERSIELFIVILGILKAGGAYVPLDKSYPEERLLIILNEGPIPILVTTSENQTQFKRYQGKVVVFKESKAELEQNLVSPLIKPQQLAYIIYTSGSTGKPKGVLIEHKSIVHYAKWFADYSGLKPKALIDFSSNHAFDFALTTTVVPLLFGATIVICDDKVKKDPNLFLDYLETNKIQFTKLTPGYFNVLLHQAKIKAVSLDCLQKIILGGENLLVPDCASWLALFPKHILFNEYGPTEASVAVTVKKIDKKIIAGLKGTVPIGTLRPDCQYYLLDKNNNPVSKGEVGELYLGGPCLARGYLNEKRLTAKSFIKIPFSKGFFYKTGDLCRRIAKDELDCIGRIDYQLKIRGYRVELAEIETLLILHPAVKSALVNAIRTEKQEKVLIAYFILKNKKQIKEGDLAQFLKRYLPDFMVPAFFIQMESFPLTANDKIDRKALPLPLLNTNSEYPRNPLENTIAEIWSNELGFRPIGIKDNFFELGGHSLSAARIMSTLVQVLGKEISLQDFYQNPTIVGLAKLLNKQKTKVNGAWDFAKKYDAHKILPLSNFQFTLWLATLFAPKVKKLNLCESKRFRGHLDEKRLNLAFKLLFKKHEVLNYKLGLFTPTQQVKKDLKFKLQIKNLESLTSAACEKLLEQSLVELASYSWPKSDALFTARVFYLREGETELQLCLSHHIADDRSMEILFSDLSNFYQSLKPEDEDRSYRQYLAVEQSYIDKNFDNDQMFWQLYLQDVFLFAFPPEHVLTNMKKSKRPYSHYTEIPQELIDNLRNYCLKNHIPFDVGLTAILFLALSNCCGELNANRTIGFQKVKSTRDRINYDNTLGCFLNLESFKLTIYPHQTFKSICEQIYSATINTSPYQKCSSLVKIASINNFRQSSRLTEWFCKLLISFYNLLIPVSKLNPKIVNSALRLNRKKANNFLININIQSSFLNEKDENSMLFGLPTTPIVPQFSDLLAVDNFFDLCFLGTADQKRYMVISANLSSEFYDLLKNELLKIWKSFPN